MSDGNRSESRSNVFLTAALEAGGQRVAVRLRNISPSGALVDGAQIPPIGTPVRLLRGRLGVDGLVAWRDEHLAGLTFTSSVNVSTWVERVGHAGQQRVDRLVDAIRNNETPVDRAREPGPGPGAGPLKELSEALDRACERLAGHPLAVRELGDDLLRLDVIAQQLRQMSGRDR